MGLFHGSLYAQSIQKGYAKTKGKLDAKGQVIPGKPLEKVVVQAKGRNETQSDTNGCFAFPIPSQTFYLSKVEKDGYQLMDFDMLTRQYTYSPDTLILSFEKPKEQDKENLNNERKIRQKLQKDLEDSQRKYDSLLERHLITEEDYNKAIQKLYDNSDHNTLLIKGMVSHYAKIDFDYVDDYERTICNHILNGDLFAADSMINARGNVPKRVAQWHREKDEIAKDCYHKYEIHSLSHRNDSAAYYLTLRAGMDSLNVEWQLEAANYISNFTTDYASASSLYDMAMRMAKMRFGEQSPEYASTLVEMIRFCQMRDDYPAALDYANQATSVLEALPDKNIPSAEQCYKNMGILYDELGDTLRALDFYSRSLALCEDLYGVNNRKTASAYHNLGAFMTQTSHFAQAMEYFNKSSDILHELHDTINGYMSSIYQGMSVVFKHYSEYDTAKYYARRCIDISTLLFGEEHPTVGYNYYNLGSLYMEENQLDEAIPCFERTIDIYTKTLGEFHQDVAECYNSLGLIYKKKGAYDQAMAYFGKALDIYHKIFDENHFHFVSVYNNIGQVYVDQKNYEESEKYHLKALKISQAVHGENHTSTATCLDNLGQDYLEMGDNDKALECALRALSIRQSIYGDTDNIELATSYSNVANCYQKMGQIDLALEYMDKCGHILDKIYKDEENTYHAIFKFNQGVLYRKQGNLTKAIAYAEEAVRMLLKMIPEDHPVILKMQGQIDEMKAEAQKP